MQACLTFRSPAAGLAACLAAAMVWAPGAAADAAKASPYAGEERGAIKALSPEEVASLLGGKGMGFAKAAELNGYPGPAHVLELGDALALTPEQRQKTRALFASMEQEAKSLGKALVAAERELDHLFASRTATPEAIAAALARTGELQTRLRGVHLRAHIEQTAILTPAQTSRYAELRGYAGVASRTAGDAGHGHHAGHGHRPGQRH